MKMIKRLRTSWFLGAMIVAVVVGELIAWQICGYYKLRFPPVVVATLCIGAVAAFVAWQYDGTD
jgi:hypothetical protein